MDNLCHTLVGAALGEAGFKRRTRFGSATLMIASNLPDIDVLVFATDALLPPLLAGVMLFVASRRPATSAPSFKPMQALLLSYIGVILHVSMDLLNTYGVRLLMPFSQRWFYGDVLFIIDPWLWLVLGTGVGLSLRRRAPNWSRASLVVAAAYVLAMLIAARAARAEMVDRWQQVEGQPPQALMVGPIAVTPLQRQIIIDAGDRYETGMFTWRPRNIRFDTDDVRKNDSDRRVAVARTAPNIRAFLIWSRFPFWTVEPVEGGTRVTVGDMRFNGGRGVALRNFTQSTIVRGP